MLIKAPFQQTSHICIRIWQKLSINLGKAKQPKPIKCLRRNIKTTVNCSHMHDHFIFFSKKECRPKNWIGSFQQLRSTTDNASGKDSPEKTQSIGTRNLVYVNKQFNLLIEPHKISDPVTLLFSNLSKKISEDIMMRLSLILTCKYIWNI